MTAGTDALVERLFRSVLAALDVQAAGSPTSAEGSAGPRSAWRW
jgi:hypothetical protein